MSSDHKDSPVEHGAKKSGAAKRKGSVLELERLKKREKELHVMKLSQEWDMRRQKRRMDRQKWLQQRRDQNLPIWQRVGNLRVQATDETKLRKTSETLLEDGIKATTVVSANTEGKLQENCTTLNSEELESQCAAEEIQTQSSGARDGETEPPNHSAFERVPDPNVQAANQDCQSVVVKLERRDSDEFCKSNDSRSSSPTTNHDAQRFEEKDIYQSKAWKQYEPPSLDVEKEPAIGAYQQLVTMVNSHPKTYGESTNASDINNRTIIHYQNADERYRQQSELYRRHSEMDARARQIYEINGRSRHPPEAMDQKSRQHYEIDERSRRPSDVSSRSQSHSPEDRSHTSVIVQAMRQSGIAHAFGDSEPALLLASEPVRFEDVIREGGTTIQRLETSTAGIIGKAKSQGHIEPQQGSARPRSRSPQAHMQIDKSPEDGQRRNSNPDLPHINKGFSFTEQQKRSLDDDIKGSQAPPTNVSMATVTSNATERSLVTCSTTKPSPSGFLVPIFKPSVGEVVYAFVPSTGATTGDSKPRLLPEAAHGSYVYPGGISRFQAPGLVDYARVMNPSATVHHGRHAPIPRAELAKRTAEAARYSDYRCASQSPTGELGYTAHQVGSTNRVTRDSQSPKYTERYQTHDAKYSNRDMESCERDIGPSVRDTRSPLRDTRSPLRDTRSPLRDTRSPLRDTRSPLRETRPPLRDPSSTLRDTRSPLHDTRLPLRDTRSPLRDTRSPLRDTRSPLRDTRSPLSDTRSFSRDTESPTTRYSDGGESLSSHSSAHARQISIATEERLRPHAQTSPELSHAQPHKTSEVNGFSRVEHTPLPPSGINGQPTNSASSSPFSATSSETILNPTAIYVRPKLVPREIIAPQYGSSSNVPIVEYIKTDSICSKQLEFWTARDVAQFVAATDCADNAGIFLDQDIDGKAVLLLSQDIFVNKLSLKLGTAMKLYNHIANLRTAMLM